jgi:hypothetical protein
MSTDHRVYSSFYNDFNVVQQVAVVQSKGLLIDVIREIFRGDSEYPYVSDSFGFPILPEDPTLPLGAGGASALIITDIYRYETKMFPSIVVEHNRTSYKPVSFNQNDGTLLYEINCFLDENSVKRYTRVPKAHVFAGAWEQTFNIVISTEDVTVLQELTDIVTVGLMHVFREDLRENGLFIKSISAGGEEAVEHINDYIYKQTLSIETRSEWRREIPVGDLVETVLFSIGVQFFGDVEFPPNNPFKPVYLGGRSLVRNDLDIITYAGTLEGFSTENPLLTITEQEILE